MHRDSLDAKRWAAVQSRTASDTEVFVYGVRTTGVFCRPGCPSRTPKRENVVFYSTAEEAAKAGLRPCLRCKPLAESEEKPTAQRIRELCGYIDKHAGDSIPLAQMARITGLSAFHLQRTFKALLGVTPKEYVENSRIRKFKSILRTSGADSVTGAIYEAGYGSSSRLYERTGATLGMTPMEYRGGGEGVQITWAAGDTSLGEIMVAATDRGLCFVQFGESVAALLKALSDEYPKAQLSPMRNPAPREFQHWMDALNRVLEGRAPDVRLPVHVRATAFQLKVWKYLQSIPAGSVRSYQEVAAGIGAPRAVRAVARACASNSVALAIPCHRVIRSTGEPGGYRWGIARKTSLLDREKRR